MLWVLAGRDVLTTATAAAAGVLSSIRAQERSEEIHPISRAGMAGRPCESGAWRVDIRPPAGLWSSKAEELFLCFWTRPWRASRLGLRGAGERSEQRAPMLRSSSNL